MFMWNFLCLSFCLVPLSLLVGTIRKSMAPSSWHSYLQILIDKRNNKQNPICHLFLRYNRPNSLSLSLWDGPVPYRLCMMIQSSCWTCCRSSIPLLYWGAQYQTQHSSLRPHEGWVEGQDHLSQPAGNGLPNASQNTPRIHYWLPFKLQSPVPPFCFDLQSHSKKNCKVLLAVLVRLLADMLFLCFVIWFLSFSSSPCSFNNRGKSSEWNRGRWGQAVEVTERNIS